jgi:hypothetical protein
MVAHLCASRASRYNTVNPAGARRTGPQRHATLTDSTTGKARQEDRPGNHARVGYLRIPASQSLLDGFED